MLRISLQNDLWRRCIYTAALALLVAGSTGSNAFAQRLKANGREAISLRPITDFLPSENCEAVALIDVRAVVESAGYSELERYTEVPKSIPLFDKDLPIEQIEEVLFALTLEPAPAGRWQNGPMPLMIVRTQHAIFDDNLPITIRLLDPYTVAFHPEPIVLDTLGTLPRENSWTKLLDSFPDTPIRAAATPRLLADLAIQSGPINPFFALEPLWKDVKAISAGVRLDNDLELDLRLNTSNPKKIVETLKAIKWLSRNYIDSLPMQLENIPDMTAQQQRVTTSSIALGSQFVGSLNIRPAGKQIVVTANVASDVYELAAMGVAEIALSNKRRLNAFETNNMKQLLLALHNYESAYRRLPAAVMIDEDSGEKHSWRVAILPFLEQSELYNEYRKDEPWDSPNNLKVLENMPSTFASINAAGGQETPYQAIVSEGGALTLTKSGEKPGLRHVTDGTSNTIGLIKIKPLVPWTKPVDYVAPDEPPFDHLVNDSDPGILVGIMDGSVRFLTEATTADIWQAMLTRAGGEHFEFPR